MNLKGCLRSAQIFNAASPPIDPISQGFPYNYSSRSCGTAHVHPTSRCDISQLQLIPSIFNTVLTTGPRPRLRRVPSKNNSERLNLQIRFIHPFSFIFELDIVHKGTHYYYEPEADLFE